MQCERENQQQGTLDKNRVRIHPDRDRQAQEELDWPHTAEAKN